MTKGGRRDGAGRPARPNASRHNVYIDNAVWKWLDSQGASEKIENLARNEMYKNYTVKIFSDEDGMFGAEGPEGYDVDATVENYHTEIRKLINQQLPGIEIETSYGPYGGASIRVEGDSLEMFDDIRETVEAIEEQVYNGGAFWVTCDVWHLDIHLVVDGTDDWEVIDTIKANSADECVAKAEREYGSNESFHWTTPTK